MAATAVITMKIEVADLTTNDENLSISFTHNVTPAEIFHGYTVVGDGTINLNIGNITDTDLIGVLLIAKGTANTDYIGILVDDDGTSTPSMASGNMTLNAGEAVYMNFGGTTQGLTSGNYIRIEGAAATTAIEYFCFGK